MSPVSKNSTKKNIKRKSLTLSPQIRYRLYRIVGTATHHYQICIKYLNEHACAAFQAKTSQLARQIYRKVVEGKVTPCTLLDVVQDLASE